MLRNTETVTIPDVQPSTTPTTLPVSPPSLMFWFWLSSPENTVPSSNLIVTEFPLTVATYVPEPLTIFEPEVNRTLYVPAYVPEPAPPLEPPPQAVRTNTADNRMACINLCIYYSLLSFMVFGFSDDLGYPPNVAVKLPEKFAVMVVAPVQVILPDAVPVIVLPFTEPT